jgi:hypothetical protein
MKSASFEKRINQRRKPIMTRTQQLLAATLLLSSAAFAAPTFADEMYPRDTFSQSSSMRSRADVYAELVQARQAGEMNVNDSTYPFVASTGAGLTRAQVQSDVAQARAAGQLSTNLNNYPVIKGASHS